MPPSAPRPGGVVAVAGVGLMFATPLAVAGAIAVAAAAASGWLIGWLRPRLPVVAILPARVPAGSTRQVVTAAGVAIVLVTLAAAVAAAWLDPGIGRGLAALLLPAACVAAVRPVDDIRPLPPLARLMVHVAAAAAAVQWLGPVERVWLGLVGELSLGAWAWPVTMLWIVGLTNAFNFMDGVDGMAGIVAAACGMAVAAALGLCGSTAAGFVAAAFTGAVSGFLAWNWPPARVFMGDVGSTFCGFFLAAVPLVLPASARPAALAVVALACWPFIVDTAVTLLARLVRGRNVLQSHRSHLYQRLVAAGWSHRAVAAMYGAAASFSAAVGLSALVGAGATGCGA